jgi:hypothetical protein
MLPDNYPAAKSLGPETTEVICRNCNRKRQAVRAVARLLPQNEDGVHYTEVCHECLNEERDTRGVGLRTR